MVRTEHDRGSEPYVLTEKRPDGTLVLSPDREKLSEVSADTEGQVFRDHEFIEHLDRVAASEDDLGDYESE